MMCFEITSFHTSSQVTGDFLNKIQPFHSAFEVGMETIPFFIEVGLLLNLTEQINQFALVRRGSAYTLLVMLNERNEKVLYVQALNEKVTG